MKVLYCNIGDMNSYNGIANDSLKGGGGYNKNNIGHEVNNFTNHDGVFYGYVQSINNTIDISKHFDCDSKAEYAENILVVWVVKKKYIIGYYKNAAVYRKLQFTPDEIQNERKYSDYNIRTKHAVLIPREERNFEIAYPSRMNIWYGDEITNQKVLDYINAYELARTTELRKIDSFTEPLVGKEREAIVKIRENQSQFRSKLIKKYHSKCCLCGVVMEEFLIASHIKPWCKSDDNEKLSPDNGLLLCPNHDKLFDSGYISFDDNGKILISSQIDDSTAQFMNICTTMRINPKDISDGMVNFLKYHRKNIFKR